MNPNLMQTVCQIGIAVFSILAIICGYASFHYGKKVNENKANPDKTHSEQLIVDKDGKNVAEKNISFQKLIIFHTEVFKDTFQLGAVIKLFNEGSKSHMIDGCSYNDLSFEISGGYGDFSGITFFKDKGELIENNYIKPNSDSYYKILLPIKYQWHYPEFFEKSDRPAPKISLNGNWQIVFKKEIIKIKPRMSLHYETVLSLQEWELLLKPKSAINPENIIYKPEPINVPRTKERMYHLLYNPDPSASLQIKHLSHPTPARNRNGVLIFFVGNGIPPTKDGWILLGHTYEEVWSDPKKLKLYNSVKPPENGEPMPLGFMGGLKKEMLGK